MYGHVSILVGDPNPFLCEAIQGTFVDQGLSNVTLCPTAQKLVAALDGNFVDLIVLDSLLPGGDLADIVQRVRRQTLGKNPFVTVIGTVGNAEAPGESSATKTIWDAGVDDIVPKPLTVDRLFNRVSTLIQNRRQFTISADYVGPTRLSQPNADDRHATVRDVPNILRSRIVDMASNREIEDLVNHTYGDLNNDLFETTVNEISRLVTRIAGHFESRGSAEALRQDTHRLIFVSEAWRQDYDGPSKDVVADLAGMLITLARRILDTSPAHRIVEVDLLIQLNQAVRVSIDVDRREARFFQEIRRTIMDYTSRT